MEIGGAVSVADGGAGGPAQEPSPHPDSLRLRIADCGLRIGLKMNPSPHPDPLPSHRMGAEREQQTDANGFSEVCCAAAGSGEQCAKLVPVAKADGGQRFPLKNFSHCAPEPDREKRVSRRAQRGRIVLWCVPVLGTARSRDWFWSSAHRLFGDAAWAVFPLGRLVLLFMDDRAHGG